MAKFRKKGYLDKDVYQTTLDRIRYLYTLYDDVAVSFSGGKDSTATLLCTIEVARELGRLPVKALFYDEEAIHPPTIEYVARTRDREDVDLEWYCLPYKLRNACSNVEPEWYPWDPDKRELWVREMPECAITEHPRFERGMSMQDWGIAHYRNTGICVLQGIRTQESLRRYRAVSAKKNDAYIVSVKQGGTVFFAYPIYDWSSSDVWKIIQTKNEDYNHTYDVFNRTSLYEKLLTQRVCPPFGEEPLRGLWLYAQCFPEMWEKMIHRVPGAATAARYGNTELYSRGKKDDDIGWREHIENVLLTFDEEYRAMVKQSIHKAIKQHRKKTPDPIPEEDPHPLTGCSWKFLAKMAIRGDFKARVIGSMQDQGTMVQRKMGLSQKEAEEKYGWNRRAANQ